jgi:uncharacterized protein YybS (DUF2232 family)
MWFISVVYGRLMTTLFQLLVLYSVKWHVENLLEFLFTVVCV